MLAALGRRQDGLHEKHYTEYRRGGFTERRGRDSQTFRDLETNTGEGVGRGGAMGGVGGRGGVHWGEFLSFEC